MNTSGLFISFEGLDFAGKSTQIKLLTDRLKLLKLSVTIIREPGGTPISERIREILLDLKNREMTDICELLLYSAARHQLISQKIRKFLDKGTIVITDRYVDSTTAYQGYGRQLPMSFISHLNQIVTEGLLPDITFFLDLRYRDMLARKKARASGSDRLEIQGRLFFERIRDGYFEIARQNRDRFKIIDAAKPVHQLGEQIWEFVAAFLPLKDKL